MIDIKTLPTLEEIRQMAAIIGELFHPNKIILFGSYAHGRPTRDSDADLMVVMDTPLRNVEQAVAIRKKVNFPFAVDLLVRTPEQISQRLALGDNFLKDILTTGIVLYEANNTRMD
jgi:predicted nucleotidyltransferase